MFKKLIAVGLVISAVFITGCGNKQAQEEQEQGEPIVLVSEDKYEDGRDFSSILTKQLDEKGKNLVFSPLSAYTAIAMAAEGAEGDTLAQLENILGGSMEEIRAEVRRACSELSKEDDENNSTLLAQSVWTKEGTEFSEEYMHTLAADYNADMFSGKLSDESIMNGVNDWARDKTKGLIDPFMNKPFSEDTALALLNALYFKGSWVSPFDDETVTDDFTDIEGKISDAEYMTVKDTFKYIDNEDALGVVLPYTYGKTFTAVMPKREGETPSELLYRLGTEGLRNMADSAEAKGVDVRLPKFESESTLHLEKCFTDRGFKLPFEESADFSGTGIDDLFISEILQKTKIDVNEKGTVAAAVTSVMMDESCQIIDSYMMADFSRPFLYMITDSDTEMPLFIGLYNYNK